VSSKKPEATQTRWFLVILTYKTGSNIVPPGEPFIFIRTLENPSFCSDFLVKLTIMHHLAIMRKSWGLLLKILTGEKTIESRWYKNKYSPWDKINKGDIVYFKNSGESVTVKTEVFDILQYAGLKPERVREILQEYGAKIGLGINEIDKYYEMFKEKNYCLLIFLKNPEKIEPFEIDKSGFGAMSAWIMVDDISRIKVK